MAGTWSAMSKGTRVALVVVGAYLVEAVVVKLTSENTADGDASIIIGAFATAFAAGILALALQSDYVSSLRLRWRLRRGAESAPAKVASVVAFHGSDFNYPVFEYTTPDGATHRHADASSRSLNIGEEARVRYLADDADRAAGPLGRFNAVVFATLTGLGGLFAVIMPILTIQAIVN